MLILEDDLALAKAYISKKPFKHIFIICQDI